MDKKEQLKNLYIDAFGDEKEYVDYVFDNLYSEKSTRTIEKDGKILSVLYFLPRQLNFNNCLIPSVFISGVSTTSTERGKGYMKSLIRDLIDEFSNRPIGAFFLSPKKEEYYISQEFCTILRAKKTTITPKEPFFNIKKVENPEEFHFLQFENTKDKQAYFMRSRMFSSKVFGATNLNKEYVYKVYDKEKYVGYFIKDTNGIFEYSINKGDLPRVQKEPCKWYLYGEGDSFIMARIINPFIFFKEVPCAQGFSVEFKIKDDFIHKEYDVKFVSEGGILNCKQGENPIFTVNVEQITKWAFGQAKIEGLPDLWIQKNDLNFGFFDRYF